MILAVGGAVFALYQPPACVFLPLSRNVAFSILLLFCIGLAEHPKLEGWGGKEVVGGILGVGGWEKECVLV